MDGANPADLFSLSLDKQHADYYHYHCEVPSKRRVAQIAETERLFSSGNN